MIQILHYTTKNPFLNDLEAIGNHDLSYWKQSNATEVDKLIEYAGRVCYHSTDRMGIAPGFITDRLREGHEDIIEHGIVTICYSPKDMIGIDYNSWAHINRYTASTKAPDGRVIVTANLRSWRDILAANDALTSPQADQLQALLCRVSPQVFGPFAEVLPVSPYTHYPAQVWRSVGRAKITLLAANYKMWGEQERGIDYWDQHGTASFLIEGVSRAFSHQMVRYRKMSFSQESTRYVELSKGQWKPIIPPAMKDVPQAIEILDQFYAQAEQAYRSLRDRGYKKEDARFVLPQCAETRMVVSGSFDAWKHFLWQRALDKAAQWEIRYVGQAILKTLWGMAPDVFDREMKALITMPEKDKVRLV